MTSSLHQSLNYLDHLPETLYSAVVTHHHCKLEQRSLGVLFWRNCLLQGILPEQNELDWPLMPDQLILIEKLKNSKLVPYCKNNISRTDQLLLEILDWLKGDLDDFPKAEDPAEQNNDSSEERDDASGHQPSAPPSSFTTSSELSRDRHEHAGLSSSAIDPFDWPQQADRLKQLDEMMKDYAVVRKLGWDLSRGLLARQEWTEILRLHKTLKQSQYLKNIINLIGRKHQQKAGNSGDIEQQLKSSARRPRQQRNHFSHHVPMQASGITRSDDIGRMLPSELSSLGHPVLKSLWHVKRAEATLLSYQYEGVLSEHLPVYETQSLALNDTASETLQSRGAIIIALDTSASMKGQAEHLAKAIVLETMRVAIREQRPCFLMAFSGPDEIQEYELSQSEQGWSAVLDIIALSFHGGTDVSQIVHRVASKLTDQAWQFADLLLVSDSRFNVSDELVDSLASLKQDTGLRLHGINVSSWNSSSMERLCQPLYRITKF